MTKDKVKYSMESQIYRKEDFDSEEYFEAIPNIPDAKVNHMSVFDKELIFKLREMLTKNSFTLFFVSFGSDQENLDFSVRLGKFLKQETEENYMVAVRLQGIKLVDNSALEEYFSDGKLISYGSLSKTMNTEMVINEKLDKLAKLRAYYYENAHSALEEELIPEAEIMKVWNDQSFEKAKSNRYSAASIPFKLSLIGIKDDFTEEEFEKRYKRAELENNPRDVLAAQEKYRWNAYYLSMGFLPMKKKDLEVTTRVDGSPRIKNQDASKRLHACLTTLKGLDQYEKYTAEMYLEKGKAQDEIEASILADVTTYDYQLMDKVANDLKQNAYTSDKLLGEI